MGIRISCPNGHQLNVKENLAGKRGICPQCGAKFDIPSANGAAQTATPTAANRPNESQTPPIPQSTVVTQSDTATAAERSSAQSAAASGQTDPPSVAREKPAASATTRTAAAEPIAIVAAESQAPASPAEKYIARRERARRIRTRIAIAMLLAAIALAAMLVWIVWSGPITLSLGQPVPATRRLERLSDPLLVGTSHLNTPIAHRERP